MLTKFESKSNRVKGLSFHISRPWILTSLHNGVIQLWDYRMGTLLDRFDEHDGPVRGVHFHRSQPLFVSGGDDYKLKIWDYKLRRCLFTLLGHLDYIRTVQFHHEYPWIVSSSDDQTIRIWNWQSRSCVSVLTGHNHYVMSALFHPKDDLVVSASLDQTVRVWDTTGLRKKTVRGAPPSATQELGMGGSSRVNSDLFGGSDAVVKYVLEGHDRGVNYAAFHPTLPLIVSSADDRQVKLWRMNDTKAWEVDTMRGHTNNVSCVLFHPRHELIISNSEDRSVRVWDISKRMGVQTFRRESDRFWILAAHPSQNLLAAGHDSGMSVFKLERERPALDVTDGCVYYVKERYLRLFEFANSRDVPVVSLRRSGTLGTGIGNVPRTLTYNAYNTAENNFLIFNDTDGGGYELLSFAKDAGQSDSSEAKRGPALGVTFVTRNRFAVLDKSKTSIFIKNFQNEILKKFVPPTGSADGIFFAGTVGRVLLKQEEKMTLYETQSHRVLAEVVAPRVKYVIWSHTTFAHVALMSKHQIVLCDRQLAHLTTISETVRIKSGIWCSSSDHGSAIFVYTTLNHIKYCLTNGDTGIIRTLDVPVYLTACTDSTTLHCLDREGKTRTIAIDLTECQFKIALNKKKYGKVMQMVKHSRLCGRAIISYLTSKGYPEVALHFVDDEKTRFELALSCGNLQVALNSACELDNVASWKQLAAESLRQGNVQVVEMAYQRTKDFERLSFLYLLTGNRAKLKKMMKIAEMRNDVMGQFHNALYLGDVAERVKILTSVGQNALAYLTAKSHGLVDETETLRQILQESPQDDNEEEPVDMVADLPQENPNPVLMIPPIPILNLDSENWPLLASLEPSLEDMSKLPEPVDEQQVHEDGFDQDTNGLDEDVFSTSHSTANRKLSTDLHDVAGDEWDDDDLDLGDDDFDGARKSFDQSTNAADSNDTSEFVAAPTVGINPVLHWVNHSSVAADHIAAGSFETATQLLHRQIGIVVFEPLKPYFLAIYHGSVASVPTMGAFPPLRAYLQRSGAGTKQSLPQSCVTLDQCTSKLKLAYRAFTAAKFDVVKEHFQSIIHAIPCLVVETNGQVNQVKELLAICREYLLSVSIRSATVDFSLENGPKRHVELSGYFTHCNLQPSHSLLTLKIAMTAAFKSRNYIAAASFGRRLLELPEVQSSDKQKKLRDTAKKVIQKSEKEARNEHDLDYKDNAPFTLCARTLLPMYRNSEAATECPYCAASYKMEFKGTVCNVCDIARIGVQTLGLVVSNNN